jgi:transcriptional regulator with XRE-family HTH domain
MTATVGTTIKLLREGRGWTQEHLATVADVAIETIQRLEAGKTLDPRPGTLMALAAALNTDVSRLLRGVSREEIESLVDDFTCRHCGAALAQRTSIPLEHGECDLDEFECGASLGWQVRPCPKDPRFPAFEDYALRFEQDADRWLCYPMGTTEAARAVTLEQGYGDTKEESERWVRRSYIAVRDGYEAAQAFLRI